SAATAAHAALWEADAESARKAAAAAVLRKWNMALLGSNPENDSVEAILAFSEARGFATEYLRPALDQLLAIELPAFVRVEEAGESRWVAVVESDAETLRTTGGTGELLTWERGEFKRCFTGDAIIPWRDETPGGATLPPGSKGAQV